MIIVLLANLNSIVYFILVSLFAITPKGAFVLLRVRHICCRLQAVIQFRREGARSEAPLESIMLSEGGGPASLAESSLVKRRTAFNSERAGAHSASCEAKRSSRKIFTASKYFVTLFCTGDLQKHWIPGELNQFQRALSPWGKNLN